MKGEKNERGKTEVRERRHEYREGEGERERKGEDGESIEDLKRA